jgi:hypothetical protein
MHHIVHYIHCNTCITYIVNTRKKSGHIGVAVVLMVGVGTTTSGHAIELIRL